MTNLLRDGSLAGSRDLSEKHKAAGNYEKAHRVVHGMRVSIENAAGTKRKGTDPEGKAWEQQMSHDYGYVRGTKGYDKDHIDAFFGPEADGDLPVHVIDQNKKGSEDFDESKAMIGFKDLDDAVIAYHRNYPAGWDGFRGVTTMPMSDFKTWAYGRKNGQRKPAADYVKFKQDTQIQAFAGGGQVSKVTTADSDRALDELDAQAPFVGYRSAGKRRLNDRQASKDVPVAALRGLVAGTAGLPGDLEGLARTIHNLPDVTPVGALIKALVGKVDPTPALPTSDFYNEWLPGPRPEGAVNKAAETLGNVAGLDPFQVSRAARPVARAAEKGVGALGQAAEQLYRQAESSLSLPLAREAFAAGGTVVNKPTVGLATFATGDQGQAATQPQPAAVGSAGGPSPTGQLPYGGSANGTFGQLTPGMGQLSFNPTQVSGAPYLKANDPYSQAIAQMGGAMGAGWSVNGIKAFMPGDLNAFDQLHDNNTDSESGSTYLTDSRAADLKGTMDLVDDAARQLGYDVGGYRNDDPGRLALQFDPAARGRHQAYVDAGMTDPAEAGWKGSASDKYDGLNKDLQNFYRIRAASAGWDGKGDPRSTATTMYYQQPNGDLMPISSPKFGRKPEHRGWAREEGAETIAGLSMMLPAFGGWAGLLGNGAAGTLTAGGGLGLTGSLPAGVVNAGMGALTGGGSGALAGGLGNWVGSSLGSQVGGQLGGQIGGQLGSQVGRAVYNQTNRG